MPRPARGSFVWQRNLFDVGLPGPDAGHGGKFLLLPPGYDGEVPSGDDEVRATMRWVEPYKLGRPFFWIQDELVVGVPSTEMLDRALARASPAP